MKKTFLEQRKQTGDLLGGLLSIIVNLFLASGTLTPPADTGVTFMFNRSGNSAIYRMNPDEKQLRRFTKPLEYDSAPAWSPTKK